jgi:hypothetical protein
MEKNQSIWINWLNKNNKDPYQEYKSILAVKVEEFISSIQYDLIQKNQIPTNNSEAMKKLAINLVMEQLLQIQYENSQEAHKAMLINLFTEHPILQDFRMELIQELTKNIKKHNSEQQKPKITKFNQIKKLFKK